MLDGLVIPPDIVQPPEAGVLIHPSRGRHVKGCLREAGGDPAAWGGWVPFRGNPTLPPSAVLNAPLDVSGDGW